MNTPQSPETSAKPNKLIIRSEVLAVIRHLTSTGDTSRQERAKQLKRLHDINQPEHVQDILVKELARTGSTETMQVLIELLMELGNIEFLQERLWAVIRDPKTPDEVKDGANLVLRHLGDDADPNLYLEYLSDPQGLIGRETARMLEVSTENPEALIDFIDFILSLSTPDQARLLEALHRDYPAEYIVNIFVPLLESDPAPEIWEQLVLSLGNTKSLKAAEALERFANWPEERLPIPKKLVEKAIRHLRIAGAFRNAPEEEAQEAEPHPLVKDTTPYQCFATLSDGIGNQGLLFSRQRPNGDISMMSVAVNDVHGIIDCFGFYQLSVGDFHKIVEKFHEGASKIKVSAEFCRYKLKQAVAINQAKCFRIPYEYRCWEPLLEGLEDITPAELDLNPEWVRKKWFTETGNLYQHPDFNSWFLEQGDEASVTRILQRVDLLVEDYLLDAKPDVEAYCKRLEDLADNLVNDLFETGWLALLTQRLAEAAYLLDCQSTHTFRNLAATEAFKLQSAESAEARLTGFSRAYGRRCVAEELLRLRMGSASYDQLTPLVDTALTRWKF